MENKIVILGGGIAGLSAAYFLGKHKHKSLIIEKETFAGGLASSHYLNGYFIDKYYRHIFRTDKTILNLLKELGLSDDVRWNKTKMGFYYNNSLYKLVSPVDLLFFKPLSFLNRIKFGLSILKAEKSKDIDKLDRISASEWLIKEFGEEAYEKIFRPMLKTKYGLSMDKASAAFVCGRLRARAKSREGSSEVLGYLDGAFQRLIDKLVKKIEEQDSSISLESEVLSVKRIKEGFEVKIRRKGKVTAVKTKYLLNTLPLNELSRAAKFSISKIKNINYQGVVCVLLRLKKELSDFYWINILSDKILFGVVVEHTNYIAPSNYRGDHIVYLANYYNAEDCIFQKSDKEVIRLYLDSLKKMFPKFNEQDILQAEVGRSKFATPLFVKGYKELAPGAKTDIKGLYLTGSFSIYPRSRNMNNILKSSFYAASLILNDLENSKQLANCLTPTIQAVRQLSSNS